MPVLMDVQTTLCTAKLGPLDVQLAFCTSKWVPQLKACKGPARCNQNS